MKTSRLMWTTMLGITLAISIPAVAQNGPPNSNGGGTCRLALTEYLDVLPIDELSEAEAAAILHLREEEKLARDVYLTLSLYWETPIFTNIARAEQRHMDLVGLLVSRHEIEDSVIDDRVGIFGNPDFDVLFVDLTTRGQQSLLDALAVGATIEDLDLADLAALIDLSDEADVDLIAQNLAVGTRNHLRAFVSQIEANDSSYEPQFLGQTVFDAVVDSNRERGIVVDEFGDVMAECGRRNDSSGGGRGQCGEDCACRGGGNCDGSGPNGQRGSGGGGKGGGGNGTCGGQGGGGTCNAPGSVRT